jgi:hypothetical protein
MRRRLSGTYTKKPRCRAAGTSRLARHVAAEVDDMLELRQHRTTASARDAGYRLPPAQFYERFDAVARGRAPADGVDFHRLILDRLTANREHAEAAGWTACALERAGGSGPLRLVGAAPASAGRSVVPDWTAGVAADAVGASGATLRHAASDAPEPYGPRIVRG